MRCIFCKSDSSASTSIEHIIPESLGNTEHILPPGVVCDACNNYFARKIEGPLLESNYFVHARFRNVVQSKKGRVPPIKGIHVESATIIELSQEDGGSVYPSNERNTKRFIESVLTSAQGRLVFPVPTEPDEYVVSRFLGKVAIEALARTALSVPGGLNEIVDKQELDLLRNYVRRGSTEVVWPFYQRRIYPEDAVFYEEGYGYYEVLHEHKFLYPFFPESVELYLVLAIFGVEYTLNMDAPNVSGYVQWLRQNENKSPLYMQ